MRISSLQAGYPLVARELLHKGAVSRNERTDSRIREIIGFDLHIADPFLSLPVGVGRKLNPAIGVIEALQLVGGWSDPELQCRTSPHMDQFRDGGVFHGAYGLRIANQVPLLIDRLRHDHTSRQAILTIWDPMKDAWDGPKDLPCTVTLQFLIRNERLECLAYMRSNDFWWGLAYDVFQFTQLQVTIAMILGVGVGPYHHFAGSFHAYERDWESIEGLHDWDGSEHPSTPGFALLNDEIRHARARTRNIVHAGALAALQPLSPFRWYYETMSKYVNQPPALERIPVEEP